MRTDFVEKINKYRNKGIIIDSNLLLLLIIGTINKNHISNFKRTSAYIPEDYDTLNLFVSQFKNIITSPNILTEASNLANSLSGKYKVAFSNVFANSIRVLEEKYVSSKNAADNPIFHKFGLTDTTILELIKGQYLLITDDFKLSAYAVEKLNLDVLNFNHIRIYNW